MKKLIVLAVVAAFIAVALPALADTGFNQAKDWIATWGKCCPASSSASTPAPAAGKQCAPCVCKTDTLGNKVPSGTASCCGKTKLGL